MRKRESIPVGPEHSPGPGKTYKSTRLPVGNLHKNKRKIESTLPEKKNEGADILEQRNEKVPYGRYFTEENYKKVTCW